MGAWKVRMETLDAEGNAVEGDRDTTTIGTYADRHQAARMAREAIGVTETSYPRAFRVIVTYDHGAKPGGLPVIPGPERYESR